jgi:hypothetical protein
MDSRLIAHRGFGRGRESRYLSHDGHRISTTSITELFIFIFNITIIARMLFLSANLGSRNDKFSENIFGEGEQRKYPTVNLMLRVSITQASDPEHRGCDTV